MKNNDPTIDEIRKIRHQISKRFNHDPEKIIEYYIKLQQKYQNRLLYLSELKEDIAEKLVLV
jgi:hypothetical protein